MICLLFKNRHCSLEQSYCNWKEPMPVEMVWRNHCPAVFIDCRFAFTMFLHSPLIQVFDLEVGSWNSILSVWKKILHYIATFYHQPLGVVILLSFHTWNLFVLENVVAYENFMHVSFHDTISAHNWRRDLLIAHKEELGQLITLEQGKPLTEAIIEVCHSSLCFKRCWGVGSLYFFSTIYHQLSATYDYGKLLDFQVTIAAGYLEFFSEEAKHVYSDMIPSMVPDCQLFIIKQVQLWLFLS